MYKIYHTDPETNVAYAMDFDDLSLALKETENLRRKGFTFVTMVSENPNHVGKTGVAGIVDGKLPDGSKYDYTKNDCVGAAFKSPPTVSTDNIIVNLDED